MSDESGTETEKLLLRRALIKEMQKKTEENRLAYDEISKLKSELYALGEEITHVKDHVTLLTEEKRISKENLVQIIKHNDEIFDDKPGKKNNFLLNLKMNHAKRIFDNLLEENIPINSLVKNNEIQENDKNLETFGSVGQIIHKNIHKPPPLANEFYDMMFSFVSIKYFIYDAQNPTQIELEDFQNFRISKNTTFIELKKAACIFWCIDNDSDYVLTENTEILIYDEDLSIDYYLRNYSVANNNLKLINIAFIKIRNALSSAQTQSIREGNKFLLTEEKRAKEEFQMMNLDNNLKQIKQEQRGFFMDYPGLKTYMLNEREAKIYNPQISVQKQTSLENSFLMLLILITMFVFSVLFIYQIRDITRVHINRKFMIKLLEPPDLKNLDDVKDYLIHYVGKVLFKTDSSFFNNSVLYDQIPNYLDSLSSHQKEAAQISSMQKNYIFTLISSVHFVINNVNTFNKSETSISDSIVANNTSRYYTIYSNENSPNYSENLYKIYQETKLQGLKNSSQFQTSDQANVYLNIEGYCGYYDGSGFHGDISGKMDYFDYKNFINTYFPSANEQNNIGKTFLIDKSTRSLILLFNLYFQNSGNWMNVAIPIEFLPTGRVSESKIIIRVFNPNLNSVNSFLQINDIVRFSIICSLFLYLFLEIKNKFESYKTNFLGTISSNVVITIFQCIIFGINAYLKTSFFSQNKKDLYFPKKDQYIDTFWLAYYYNQIFFLESLQFIGIALKILDFLKMNDYIKLFFMSFDLGYVLFLKYSLIIIFSIIYLSVVAHIIWGPFSLDFITFGKALNNVLLFTLGKYDPSKKLIFSGLKIICYFVLLTIILLLFMSNVFKSLYVESLRKTVTRLGYPEDNNASSWGFKELYTWLCYCFIEEDEKKKILKKRKKM